MNQLPNMVQISSPLQGRQSSSDVSEEDLRGVSKIMPVEHLPTPIQKRIGATFLSHGDPFGEGRMKPILTTNTLL